MAVVLLASLAAVVLSAVPQAGRTQSLTGVVHVLPFESKVLGNKRNVSVYLPPGYAVEPTRRYPVLIMHDGQNVFDGATSFIPNMEWQADETADRLVRAGKLEPLIIVAIDNAGVERANEYLPTRWQMGPGREPIGGKADLYGRMIVYEVLPMIRAKYRAKSDAKNTGLAGSSFGGVVTLYLGLKHPSVFGKLGVISPSVWWHDRYLVRMVHALPGRTQQRIWLDMGTKEGYQGLKDARELRWALEDKGWKRGKDLFYMEDAGAQHNEAAWAKRMEPLLLSLWKSG